MLVLLIIFLITIPVVVTSIPVELPKERNEIRETKPENIVLSVDQAGSIYWNDLKLASTQRADRPAEEDLRAGAAARGADPRRRTRANTRASAGSSTRASGPGSRRSASSPSRRRAAADAAAAIVKGTCDGYERRQDAASEPEVMIDINTTPLIDVMLVLLVMLIITIPIQLHSVNLNMPVGNPPPPLNPPEVVKIDVDPSSTVYWNGEALPSTGRARGAGSRPPRRSSRSPRSTFAPISTPATRSSPRDGVVAAARAHQDRHRRQRAVHRGVAAGHSTRDTGVEYPWITHGSKETRRGTRSASRSWSRCMRSSSMR